MCALLRGALLELWEDNALPPPWILAIPADQPLPTPSATPLIPASHRPRWWVQGHTERWEVSGAHCPCLCEIYSRLTLDPRREPPCITPSYYFSFLDKSAECGGCEEEGGQPQNEPRQCDFILLLLLSLILWVNSGARLNRWMNWFIIQSNRLNPCN